MNKDILHNVESKHACVQRVAGVGGFWYLVHKASWGGHELLGDLVPVVEEVSLFVHLPPHNAFIINMGFVLLLVIHDDTTWNRT